MFVSSQTSSSDFSILSSRRSSCGRNGNPGSTDTWSPGLNRIEWGNGRAVRLGRTLRFQIVPFDSPAGISTATASPVSSVQERAASLEYEGFGIGWCEVAACRVRLTFSALVLQYLLPGDARHFAHVNLPACTLLPVVVRKQCVVGG